jgi:coenzyme F420-dependent glucose-6-phosphate dehydrogenase
MSEEMEMVEVGYKLSSEEHGPRELVENAGLAEAAGFSFAMISDHYHPWTSKEGQSPFVWGALGGISQSTDKMQIATGVTCPTIRIHPAIIAQAAATAAALLPGRFVLGVGSGENLNEHILGDRWPPAPVRIEMLEEAVEVIRTLWKGGMQDHYGWYYIVENAQVFSLPDENPPIAIAAEDEISAELAGRAGDGLINPGSNAEKVIGIFRDSGGAGKPAYIEFSACYHEDEAKARRIAHEYWPVPAFPGELSREIPTHTHFEQLAEAFSEDAVTEKVITGPDPSKYIEKIQKYADMGYDHICIHQVGPNQQEFFRFAEEQILPEFAKSTGTSPSRAEAGTR